jgi:hypothetical protein
LRKRAIYGWKLADMATFVNIRKEPRSTGRWIWAPGCSLTVDAGMVYIGI